MGKIRVIGKGAAGLFSSLTSSLLGGEVELIEPPQKGGLTLFFSGCLLFNNNLDDKTLLQNRIQDVFPLLKKCGIEFFGDFHNPCEFLSSSGIPLKGYFVMKSMFKSCLDELKRKKTVIVIFNKDGFLRTEKTKNLNLHIVEVNINPLFLARRIDLSGEEEILKLIKNYSQKYELVLLEPCMGIKRHEEVFQRLNEKSDCEIGEMPSFTSGVPGVRITENILSRLSSLPFKYQKVDKLSPEFFSSVTIISTGIISLKEDFMKDFYFENAQGRLIKGRDIYIADEFHNELRSIHPFFSLHLHHDEKGRILDVDGNPVEGGRIFCAGSLAVSISGGMFGTLLSSYIAGEEAARIS